MEWKKRVDRIGACSGVWHRKKLYDILCMPWWTDVGPISNLNIWKQRFCDAYCNHQKEKFWVEMCLERDLVRKVLLKPILNQMCFRRLKKMLSDIHWPGKWRLQKELLDSLMYTALLKRISASRQRCRAENGKRRSCNPVPDVRKEVRVAAG